MYLSIKSISNGYLVTYSGQGADPERTTYYKTLEEIARWILLLTGAKP